MIRILNETTDLMEYLRMLSVELSVLVEIYGIDYEDIQVRLHCKGGVVSKRDYFVDGDLVISCEENMDNGFYRIVHVDGYINRYDEYVSRCGISMFGE